MPADTLPFILQVLLFIFGCAICVFMLVGFWCGLSLRDHEPEHRPAPPPFWWWTGPDPQLDGDDVIGAGANSAKRVMRMTGRMPTATMSKAASAPSSKLPRVAN